MPARQDLAVCYERLLVGETAAGRRPAPRPKSVDSDSRAFQQHALDAAFGNVTHRRVYTSRPLAIHGLTNERRLAIRSNTRGEHRAVTDCRCARNWRNCATPNEHTHQHLL